MKPSPLLHDRATPADGLVKAIPVGALRAARTALAAVSCLSAISASGGLDAI